MIGIVKENEILLIDELAFIEFLKSLVCAE